MSLSLFLSLSLSVSLSSLVLARLLAPARSLACPLTRSLARLYLVSLRACLSVSSFRTISTHKDSVFLPPSTGG